MHAALRLGDGNALYAVHTSLELQPGPDAVDRVALAGDGERGVLVPTQVGRGLVEHGDGPPVTLGVADVHAREIRGEQGRLLAALSGLEFEYDVVGVVRIARCQQVGEQRVEFVYPRLEFGHLLGEGGVVDGEFACGFEVTLGGVELAVGRHDGSHLGEPLAHATGCRGVGVQCRVGELPLEVGMLVEQRLDLWGVVAHAGLSFHLGADQRKRRPNPTRDASGRAPST